MTLKNSLIFIFIVSLILQCVSGVSLNCATTAATGLCATCAGDYQPDPSLGNFRNCRKTVPKCSLWTADLKKCVQCSTSGGIKYNLFVEGQSCGIDYCGIPDATNPATHCSQCAIGYRLSPDRTQCIGRITGCSIYNSHISCKQCIATFQPTPAFDMCLPGSIRNCFVYRGPKSCLLCSDNFQPTPTLDACNPGSISNCKRYYYPSQCQLCNTGYTLNFDKTRCIDTIPFCRTYDANGLCTKCVDTYMQNAVDASNPLNTKCIPGTLSQCRTYTSNAVCQKCNDFFEPAAGFTSCAIGSIADCISYSANTVCSKCVDPKMPIAAGTGITPGSSCTTGSVSKCKTYSAINTCAACETGYTLLTNTCVIKITNCKTFTSDTACAVCQNTFQPTADFTKCLVGSIVGCDQYTSKGLCKTCGVGYTINLAKTACAGRIANCKTYTAATVDPTTAPNGFVCSQCNDVFKPDANKLNCAAAPLATDHCIRYSDMSTCTQCDQNYAINAGACVTPTTAIPDCSYYGIETVCRRCIDTKMPNDASGASCVNGLINNCKIYTTTNVCDTCALGYTLTINPTTSATTCVIKIANCLTFTSNTVCSVCANTFEPSIDGSSCNTGTISKCNVYQSKGLCQTCQNGFAPNGAKTSCVDVVANCKTYGPSNVCTMCQDNFKSNGAGLCIAAPAGDNCLRYTFPAGACSQCKVGFGFDATPACVAITTPIASCQLYDTTTTCNKCTDPKMPVLAATGVLLKSACGTGSITDCISYSGPGTCTGCGLGFILNTNACVPQIVANCKTFTTSKTVCSKCLDNFEPTLDFKACNPGLMKNCLTYTSRGVCQVCANTFQPTTDFTRCLPGTILNCQVYQSAGLCKTCDVRFKTSTDKKKCQTLIDNCATYSDDTTCSLCLNGFYLTPVATVVNKACTAGTVLNCKTYTSNANTCDVCADTFYKASTTSCVAGAIVDCLGYTTSTQCNRCIDGKMPIVANPSATPTAITQGQTCTAGDIANCKGYSNTRTCLSCNFGYTHTPGNTPICVAKIANCAVYQTQTQCRQCASTFEPTSDFTKCNTGSITGCNIYLSKSKCSTCVNYKQPSADASSCVFGVILKCLTYQARGKCGACELGFQPNADKTQCIGKIPNCNTYTTSGQTTICAACQDTYQISTNSLTCTNPGQIINCKVYSANNVCGTCADRNWKESATSCKAGAIVDCLVYSAQAVCTKCVDGKMPDATGANCIAGTIDFCKSYSGNAACGVCNTGYTPTVSTGAACNGNIGNCKTYTTDSTCKLCENSFQPTVYFTQCLSGGITNCLTYSEKSKCSVCVDTFQPTLDFTRCLIGMIPNCKTYLSKGLCSACTAAYTVSADKTKCVDTIANCKIYNTDVTLCDQCQNTFQLSTDKKSCPAGKIAGCSVYSANNVCDTCLQRYIKVSATSCKLGTITDCLAYTSDTVCSVCIDGKMPCVANNAVTPAVTAGSLCVAGNVDNCKTYSATGTCGVCTVGFTVSTGACSPVITNCKAFNTLTSCKQCADNFMQSADSTQCVTGGVANCLSYSSNLKCSVCQDYYQPNLDFSKCQTIPAVMPVLNCKTYAFKGKCSVCDVGFKPSADMTACQNTIPNCKAYAMDAVTKVITCTTCQDTFEQDSTKKNCLTGDNANCLTYSNMNVCTKCVDKYFLASATICTLGTIVDCLTYTSSSICSKCIELKMPSSNGGTCIAGTLVGCKAYSGNLVCSACNAGYTLTTGTCVGKIVNCLTYNSDTSCKLCANNFEPTADTTACQAGTITGCKTYATKGFCTACNNGYTLSGSSCLDTIANCKTYSADGLTCTACKDTFQQDSTNKKCLAGDNTNCLTYSGINVCTKCVDKYYLASATTCTLGTITDCVVYASVGACSKCIDGKMPSSNGATCVNGIISSCKSYSAYAVCQKCQMGYTTITPFTECKSSIPNCMIYGTQTTCKQCIDQFELSVDAMRCDKGSISGCVVYEAYRKCAKCIVNLQPNLDKSRCISSIPNCDVYNTATTCKTCLATFEPTADFTKCNPGTILGCENYESIGKCLTCKVGLTKSLDSKRCDQPIPYCQTFADDGLGNPNSITCTKCVEGYFPQTNVKCVAGSIQKCRIYTSGTLCSLCELGHQLTLDTTKCYKIIPNCRKYTTTLDKCQICLTDFYVTELGQCRKIIPQCATYNDITGLCQICNVGFSLAFESTFCKDSSNLCTIPGCSKCTQAVDYCDTCIDGLQLSLDHKKCIKCSVPSCRMCQFENSCALCQDGLTLTSVFENFAYVKKCYTCNVDNCKSCSSTDTCSSCDSGYTLTTGGACVPCLFPCSTCNPTAPTKCTSCVSPTYAKTPTSTGGCIINTISNCAIYDTVTSTLCSQCQPFFKLSSDKKLCQRTCGANCKQCSGNTCSACNTGFYLGAGFCYPCPLGCLQCSSAFTCTKTATGSFFLSNNVPKPCPSFCKQCNSEGLCTTFTDNYNGFILVKNGNENVLASCQQGCQTCSPTTIEQCIVCKPGFYLKSDNKCQLCTERSCRTCDPLAPAKCLTCYPNTFRNGDVCVSCNQNCLTCQDATHPNICTSCRLGLLLTGGSCGAGSIDQCNEYLDGNTCMKCSPGYTLIDATINTVAKIICVPCLSNCRYCAKGQPSKCIDCGDNFYLNSLNTCSACSQNCKTCTSSGCTQCNPGFRVNSGFTCSKNCVQPCATCSDSDPKICNSCILGYNFIGGSCQPQTTCTGGCKRCPPGFTLNAGTCVACKGQNCRTCDVDKSTCKNCIRGFYLDASLLCSACSIECETCVAATGCSQCATGYIATKSMDKPDALKCISCQGNCATCIDTTKRCATCKTGFELKGWKCVKISRINFGLTLDTTLDIFNTKYVNLLNSLGSTRSDSDFMLFETIKIGSVIVQGSIDPVYSTSSTQFSTQMSTIQSGLIAGGSIGGMTIVSSSVTVSGYSSSAAEQSNNLGIILGICIPVGILIIAIVIYVVHKKMTPQIKDGKLDDDTKMTSKHELQKNQFEMSDNILRNN